MEKMVVEFGFGLTCLFFFLMLCIGSQFIWGVVAGLIITFFGMAFWN